MTLRLDLAQAVLRRGVAPCAPAVWCFVVSPVVAKQLTPDQGTSSMDGSCQASERELAVI
jgi:hypothetical protein